MAQSRPSTPVGIWGTDRDEANQTVLSSSAPAGTGIRRTTPIYQNYSQAHTSITGGMPNSRLMSEDPGTDNLNDVYARALEADNAYGVADNEALSGWVTDTQRGQENVNPILPSVSFPFQRPGSPESIEQVQSTDFTDDNPADLALGSDDVALRVRDVRRGSATPQSSHAPLPQAAAYESVQDMGPRRGTVHFDVQDRLEHAHLSPARSPTPYPAAASISPDDESQLESTISAIVEHYQTYHETHGSAGTPPEISLPPAPPSTPVLQSQGMFAVPSVPQNGYYLSSSPPTLSTGLLLNGAGTGAHQHESTLPLAVPPNGQNQLNLDNLEAGRQYAVTVVATRHGNGGTSADPPTTMPVGLQDRSERSRVGGPVREPAVSSQASLGSGAGVESSLLEIRDALRNRMSTATATSDWATTQGSNTQRNSIVPDGELPVFSSSSGVDLASTWDPLSMRNRQVQELNREASELRQAAGLLGNEAANSDGSQGSERYSSPQPAAQFATNGASRGRPLNTQHITSYLSTDSSQAINGAVVPYGSPLRFVRNYFTPSETLVEMSSNTDRRSQDGNVSGSGNSNSGSPSRNNRTGEPTTVLTIFHFTNASSRHCNYLARRYRREKPC